MFRWIEDAVLSVVLALLMYSLLVSMIIGNLPPQENNEAKEQCALFADGLEYSLRRSAQSIKKYKSETNIEHSIVDCSWAVK